MEGLEGHPMVYVRVGKDRAVGGLQDGVVADKKMDVGPKAAALILYYVGRQTKLRGRDTCQAE